MKLGKQIKDFRNQFSFSQEELAEKMYVSRQTISNWENDKTYPDINSLVLMSQLFGTTIDQLIKGDIETMKNIMNHEESNRFNNSSTLFTILFILSIVTAIPLIHFFKTTGYIVWLVLAISATIVGFFVDRQKKNLNIHTYKEILAFTQGKTLDEITKAREDAKRPYQLGIMILISLIVGVVISLLAIFIF